MPQVTRFFHGSQIVPDVLEVGRFYHDFFASWVYEAQYLDAEDARNSANVIGDFSIEVLAPLDPGAETGLTRFLARHGAHFNNLAYWARDCRGLAQQLVDGGIRVAVRGSGFADRLPDGDFDYVITHPKDTHGLVLEFLEDRRIPDPRDRPWWDASFWRDRHPLGIERLSHCTVAVADLPAASSVFEGALTAERVHEEDDHELGKHSVYFALADTLVELAVPTSEGSHIARHLAIHGPIVYAFTFLVRDLSSVAAHARAYDLGVHRVGDHTIVLDSEGVGGGVYAFTERRLPRAGRGMVGRGESRRVVS